MCVSSGTPPAATVVIVMCIAALVVIVVLGIYRIHTTHQDGSKEDEEGRKDPEMDWDDSNLNITVNPMEVSMRLVAKDKCLRCGKATVKILKMQSGTLKKLA